jgi:hypothetical protein
MNIKFIMGEDFNEDLNEDDCFIENFQIDELYCRKGYRDNKGRMTSNENNIDFKISNLRIEEIEAIITIQDHIMKVATFEIQIK